MMFQYNVLMWIYLLTFIFVIAGVTELILRFIINWDDRKYGEFRKSLLLINGVEFVVFGFIILVSYYILKILIPTNSSPELQLAVISMRIDIMSVIVSVLGIIILLTVLKIRSKFSF